MGKQIKHAVYSTNSNDLQMKENVIKITLSF